MSDLAELDAWPENRCRAPITQVEPHATDAERDEAWKRIQAAAKKLDVNLEERSWRERRQQPPSMQRLQCKRHSRTQGPLPYAPRARSAQAWRDVGASPWAAVHNAMSLSTRWASIFIRGISCGDKERRDVDEDE